ncbi:hypothetical protein BURPS1710b_2191 [Burkholderia pseudomallei 1710b]|uniref:Uncharacterized protein n=1 Tax=Burkholderia pseudomallei (strain 1710b) TaxID=320372 RepID=Q3JS67_BURP1|nr:hypothetical protein BURPS1710b_2191 [Burkholderia pseudomallei 1710b]
MTSTFTLIGEGGQYQFRLSEQIGMLPSSGKK